MPGFNRRGPEGMGPMTGGGRGLCNSANRASNQERPFMDGTGRGRGFGNCRRQPGINRGTGYGYAGTSVYDTDQEESLLKNEEAILKDQLAAIKQRLEKITEAV